MNELLSPVHMLTAVSGVGPGWMDVARTPSPSTEIASVTITPSPRRVQPRALTRKCAQRLAAQHCSVCWVHTGRSLP